MTAQERFRARLDQLLAACNSSREVDAVMDGGDDRETWRARIGAEEWDACDGRNPEDYVYIGNETGAAYDRWAESPRGQRILESERIPEPDEETPLLSDDLERPHPWSREAARGARSNGPKPPKISGETERRILLLRGEGLSMGKIAAEVGVSAGAICNYFKTHKDPAKDGA